VAEPRGGPHGIEAVEPPEKRGKGEQEYQELLEETWSGLLSLWQEKTVDYHCSMG
jgi:hypothetical protein